MMMMKKKGKGKETGSQGSLFWKKSKTRRLLVQEINPVVRRDVT
jgi:hypothetical protein